MYKLHINTFGEKNAIVRLSDNAFIPFCVDNSDYQAFKKAVLEGAQLLDADGNVISADFVKDLA